MLFGYPSGTPEAHFRMLTDHSQVLRWTAKPSHVFRLLHIFDDRLDQLMGGWWRSVTKQFEPVFPDEVMIDSLHAQLFIRGATSSTIKILKESWPTLPSHPPHRSNRYPI